jgi:hypothetical protein
LQAGEWGLALFSRKLNEEWIRLGAANTPLAIYHGVDFEIIRTETRLDEPWISELAKGAIDEPGIAKYARCFNNVIRNRNLS